MKTTLTIDIEFDPEVTDALSVADALDILLGTALSTPDILGEEGNPTVGEFQILEIPSDFDTPKGDTP